MQAAGCETQLYKSHHRIAMIMSSKSFRMLFNTFKINIHRHRFVSMTDRNDTIVDDGELEACGYKREMPRQFSTWSLGALSFTLTCTWLGTGSSMGISLTEASSAGTLWALPIAGVMTYIVTLGMAELASAYPVAGAQYYWSFMVARDDWKPFAAYL